MTSVGSQDEIRPELIAANPRNPRRYFNEERLDVLKTSLQEVGVLVPLIVYRDTGRPDAFVLMDGERRWRCALDLGLESVPVNIIPTPSPLENLLRMFNIHNVREDWPLISVALSLQEVIELSELTGEARLAEVTGLTRSTVRRAKRLLTLPDQELELIQSEAHLDRTQQVHREDLYLEAMAAERVLRSQLPESLEGIDRDSAIRRFVEKAETNNLTAVTDFRFVSKLVKAVDDELVDRKTAAEAARRIVSQVEVTPKAVFDEVAAVAYEMKTAQRKVELLAHALQSLPRNAKVPRSLARELISLRRIVDALIKRSSS